MVQPMQHEAGMLNTYCISMIACIWRKDVCSMLLFRSDDISRQNVACRRGYDVVLMAEHGAAPALGLELSEDAVSLFQREFCNTC